MKVHALTSHECYESLARALAPHHTVVRLRAVSELALATGNGSVGFCVVEPTARRPDVIDTLVRTLSAGDFPVVIFTSLSHAKACHIVDLQQCCQACVVLGDMENDVSLIRRIVDTPGDVKLAALVLKSLGRHIRLLPDRLALQTIRIFGGLSVPKTVGEYFAGGAVTARTGNRTLMRAGFRDAEHVLGGARFAQTWDPIRAARLSLKTVSEGANLGTVRALNTAYHVYCGMAPRRAARELTTRQVADCAVAAMIR